MTARHHQTIAEEAILDHFRNPEHEHFHSDDLWHLIPNEHRGVISLAVMALVNKKLIVGTGTYRKSAIPSRKRSPSQEYRLTELGRDRIAGVGAGQKREAGIDRPVNPTPSSHPGDRSTAGVCAEGQPGVSGDRGAVVRPSPAGSADPGGARPTGAPTSKESGRATNPPVPSASDTTGSGSDGDLTGSSSEPARSHEALELLPPVDPEAWAA